MNKLVKAAIATGVGAALLMGGAGTFAYWNDSVGVSGANITAGTLTVADTGTAGSWTVQKNGTGTAAAVADIAAFRVSPGDKLTYTKTVKVTAIGDNLVATLSLGEGSIAGATSTTANSALAGYLTKTAQISATGTGVTAGGVAGTYTFTPGSAGITDQVVTVSVVINFPKSATAGLENDARSGIVTLSGLTVKIDQV